MGMAIIVGHYVSAIPMGELLASVDAEVERVDQATVGRVDGDDGEGGQSMWVGFVGRMVAQVAVDVVYGRDSGGVIVESGRIGCRLGNEGESNGKKRKEEESGWGRHGRYW